MTEIDMPLLEQWIGRKQLAEDVITLAPAVALAATLDHDAAPELGAALPPLWHWIYFTPKASQSELGQDGHPRLGSFMPPVPLPRRMWAGGRLRFFEPLQIGENAQRETEIINITHKSGRQGDLVFLTLRHTISGAHDVAIEEEQDLVYREASTGPAPASSSAAPVQELPCADWRMALTPDPVLLFRYSALTFNAHRIHYDETYATSEEHYPGLVVQGPLTATLIADRLAQNSQAELASFTFRGQQPLFAGAPMALCGRALESPGHYTLWAETPDGNVAMAATAEMR